jgi:outer membrane protein insertion porin family
VLARYTAWIQEYVTAHGGKDKITAKIMPLTAAQLLIVFRPARAEPVVAEVSFTGNSVLPASLLQNAISEVAVGMPYNEDHFRQLLDSSIRPLYDARGRIRVAFPKITAENAKDVEGLAVTVTVDEGASYDLGGVRLEAAPDFRAEDLLKIAKLKTGDVVDFDEIGQGLDRIRKALSQRGYIRSNIQVVRHIDDRKRIVDLVLRLDEGPRFLFGKLSIEGLDLNGEAAIRKLWVIQEGKPFNAGYPDYFLSRVRQDNIFENLKKTRAEVKFNEQAHTVDVTLYFN